MSKQKVALILSRMAEQAAPSQEIDLWPALQARFVQAPLPSIAAPQKSRGTPMNTPWISSKRRLAILLAVSILLAGILFLITPQGQAMAQNLLRFFTRPGSDLLPNPTLTAAPTQPQRLVDPTAQTAAPTLTSTPTGCDSILSAHCPVEQVQQQVAFPILQLARLPKSIYLRGAVVQGQRVVLVYNCPAGCWLLFSQEPVGAAVSTEEVGASAQVKTVQIQTGRGAVAGEYLQGAFAGQAGAPNLAWDSIFGTYRLRWEAGGMQYAIQWATPPENKSGLTPNAEILTALAEGLTDRPSTALNPNSMDTAAQASLLAGFTVRIPGYTPRDWDPPFFAYDEATGFVCLNYPTGGMRDHPRLFVRESVTAPITDLQPDPNSAVPQPIQYQSLPVGGADGGAGRYTRSRFAPPDNVCNGQVDFQSTNEALQWTAQGVSYEIYAIGDSFSPSSVSKMDLQRMAESLTGVTAIPAERPDPEHLWSLQDAQKLAGFAVKTPARLPEGYAFVMARIENSTVMSLYQDQRPDLHADMLDLSQKSPMVYLYQCPASSGGMDACQKDTQDIPAQAREAVQVRGQPGFYAKGDLGADESTQWKMTWYPDHMFFTRRLSWKEGSTTYLLKLMWGGLIDKDMMVQMAESLK